MTVGYLGPFIPLKFVPPFCALLIPNLSLPYNGPGCSKFNNAFHCLPPVRDLDLCSIIFEELCRPFGQAAVGPREHYWQIAKWLWQLHSASATRNRTDVNN
jgi:hypothetical protein